METYSARIELHTVFALTPCAISLKKALGFLQRCAGIAPSNGTHCRGRHRRTCVSGAGSRAISKARGADGGWIGNPLGMEARLAPKHGVAMERVDFGGVRGKGLRAILLLPFNLLRACVQSARLLAR